MFRLRVQVNVKTKGFQVEQCIEMSWSVLVKSVYSFETNIL